jgi:hypothetical protein
MAILISRKVIHFSEVFGFVSTELTSKQNSPPTSCFSFPLSSKPRDFTPDIGHSTCSEHITALALFNPLNAELNTICHLLALLGARHILHVSGLRVNAKEL